jgi:hypothetical protein
MESKDKDIRNWGLKGVLTRKKKQKRREQGTTQ